MTTLGEKLRAALDKGDVVKKTIEAWDNHEDAIRKPQQEKQVEQQADKQYNFAVSNNVMRETFGLIKRYPRITPKQCAADLVGKGFKEGSVTSVIYQLIRAGQVVKNEKGGLVVTQEEYTPIKQVKKKKDALVTGADIGLKNERKVVIIKRTKRQDPSHGIAALKADSGDKSLQDMLGAPKPRPFIPSQIVDNLSVLHARELYDYLRKIFGGN